MPLGNYSYNYKGTDRVIVSRDRGSKRKHTGNNVNACTIIRYRVDGNIIRQCEACDFIVTNENTKTAYLIELKGRKVSEAAKQLMATEEALRNELLPYHSSHPLEFRIVASRCVTHQIEDVSTKKLRKKWGKDHVRIATGEISEDI